MKSATNVDEMKMKHMKEAFVDMESIPVLDKDLIKSFISDPAFPYLISFPRTGSHWLRMLMELYFKKPSLVRIFYYRNADQFTCYHSHDDDLVIERSNVIYLYRWPVDTIHSVLVYYGENIEDRNRIIYYTDMYARHLKKWLLEESFTSKKIVLTYEGIHKDPGNDFQRLCDFYSEPYEACRFEKALKDVTKEQVMLKTPHDPKVMNVSREYNINKQTFRKEYSDCIFDYIYSFCPDLEQFFR